MTYPTVIGKPADQQACRTAPIEGVGKPSFMQQCKAIDAAKRHDRANQLFLARLNELLASHKGAA